jgi:hypothetical protein
MVIVEMMMMVVVVFVEEERDRPSHLVPTFSVNSTFSKKEWAEGERAIGDTMTYDLMPPYNHIN